MEAWIFNAEPMVVQEINRNNEKVTRVIKHEAYGGECHENASKFCLAASRRRKPGRRGCLRDGASGARRTVLGGSGTDRAVLA